MLKTEFLEYCSSFLDRLTIIKGYLEMNIEDKKADYSLIILKEVCDMETDIKSTIQKILNSGTDI